MEKTERKKPNIRSFDFLLSAAVAAVLLLIAYKYLGVFVFGDNSLAAGDAAQQYVPLMSELRTRLFSGDLSGYSLANGLGTNFYATFFYYLASPVTLAATLITPLSVFEAFDLAVLVKCALSAGAFSYMQKKLNGSFGGADVAFSLCYAGCGFFAASYINIMWLDALIFLPLTAYGIKRLLRDGKGLFYALSLAFALITCFYTGYMLCIFSVLYFVFNLLCDRRYILLKLEKKSDDAGAARNKALFTVLIRFAACSLAAGLISAAVLLPVLSALQSSAAKAITYPDILFGIKDFLLSHLFGMSEGINYLDSYVPVSYAGMLTLTLVPAFLFAKDIPLRERVLGAVFGAVMISSMLFSPISLIWHGFSAPAGFLPRFVFMYSFLLVCAAARTFKSIKSIHPVFIALSLAASAGLSVFLIVSPPESSGFPLAGVLSLIFTAVFAVLIILARLESFKLKSALSLLLAAAAALEFTASFCTNADVATERYKVPFSTEKALCDLVDSESANSEALRTLCLGTAFSRGMRGSYYGINTVDNYSSFMDAAATYAVANLGASHNYLNSVFAYETTPLFSTYMSIGSVYAFNTSPVQSSLSRLTDTVQDESGNELSVYSAKYSLPVMFCVNKEYADWNGLLSGVKSLESLFSTTTGTKDRLFTLIEPNQITADNAERITDSEGLYESIISGGGTTEAANDELVCYFKVSNPETARITFTFTAQSSDPLYLSYSSNALNCISVTAGGKTVSHLYNTGATSPLIAVPECEAGSTVTVTASLKPDSKNYEQYDTVLIKSGLYSLDIGTFEKGYEQLRDSALTDITVKSSHISGTVNAKSGQMLYTSLAYDSGWRLYIDGMPAKTVKTGNHLLAAELTAGEHEIELIYRVPNLFIGVFLSLIGICVIITEVYTEKPRQKDGEPKKKQQKSMFKF